MKGDSEVIDIITIKIGIYDRNGLLQNRSNISKYKLAQNKCTC